MSIKLSDTQLVMVSSRRSRPKREPHTTRAVLTGLRKRGYALTLDRFDAERSSAYRIALEASAAQTGTTLAAIEPPIGESIDREPNSAASPASATAKRRSGATRTPRAA